MDNIKKLMIEKYYQITGFEPINDDWEPRIKRMLSTICKGRYTKEQIVETKDASILGNGSSGMVFTTEALCVKDAGNSTSQFIAPFKDIKYCSMDEDSIFGVDISAIKLHMRSGAVHRLSTTLPNLSLEQMQELIEYAIHLHDLDDLESEEKKNSPDPETSSVDCEDQKCESHFGESSLGAFFNKVFSAIAGEESMDEASDCDETKEQR
jgi:hypothetical protein